MSQRPVFVNKVLFERGPGWGSGERGRVMWVQGGIPSFYTCLVFYSWMFLLHLFKNHCIRKFLLWSLSVWATPLNFVPEVCASLAPPPRPGPDKNPQKLEKENITSSCKPFKCISWLHFSSSSCPPPPQRWCLLSGQVAVGNLFYHVWLFLVGHLMYTCPQTSII